eukprot:354954-Chlamydomonas_euryale.AAC.10
MFESCTSQSTVGSLPGGPAGLSVDVERGWWMVVHKDLGPCNELLACVQGAFVHTKRQVRVCRTVAPEALAPILLNGPARVAVEFRACAASVLGVG